jgi:putative CocE/NonD family hydrolase
MSVSPLPQQVIAEFNVPAMMSDGTILRANIYHPAGAGPWPVLLTRLPYGKDIFSVFDPTQFARQGYVVVVQDVRGRFMSEGEWDPMRYEGQDGAETVAWAAALPYSNGAVGMFGPSYLGFTQWAAAVRQPPALKVIAPMVTWNDPCNGVSFRGGAMELGASASWQLNMGANVLMRRHAGEADPRPLGRDIYLWAQQVDHLSGEGYWSLPLNEFAPLKQNDVAPAFFEIVEHAMDRTAFEPMTILGKHELVQVPTLNIGGWYDIFLEDTLNNFLWMRERGSTPEARQSKLLIGPWGHTMTGSVGEMHFGIGSTVGLIDLRTDLLSIHARWFNHFLKGNDTGMLNEAPIKLFVMGANIWRDEYEWPLARAVETRYYLHSAGHANTLHGDGELQTETPAVASPDHYSYDPANPVRTRGGALLMSPAFPNGVQDQRVTEEREDVLVYTSPVLAQDIEVTGPISVHLWAVSSAPDTDFVARLVDVHPDGYAQNLTDGVIRARYRDFARGEEPSLIEPGKPYAYLIDLWATSNLFQRGHRIRLDITSSNFPRWDRNPNTGHAFGIDAELVVAQQTILHDAEHPSYVVLPIVPATE